MRANDCQWKLVDRPKNFWSRSCGDKLQGFPMGGPAVNGWKNCPYCGGYLVEVPARA